MARHDILEAGFSSLDETINFGMRAIGDNTNLYEIVTVAVIRSSETNKDSEPVKIISHCQDEHIFFSIDKMLRIIKDKNISEEIGSFEFDHIVDTFCVSSCRKFMLICTQDGIITIRTLSCNDEKETSEIDKLPIVFEEKLDDYDIGECFKGTFFNDGTFYIVTCKGLVKRIVLTEDSDNGLFKSEIIMDLKTAVNICAFEYPYLCLEGNELIILNVNNKSCQSDIAIGIKHLHALESYFYAYDYMGNIYRIYPNEVLIFCLNQKYREVVDGFHDLLFIDNGEKKNEVQFHGIKKGQKEIGLLTYPGPEMVYSIEIQGPIHLVTVKEDVLFFTEIQNNSILSEIRLQIITKADPDFRLKKLLMKQLFDEAELFAKTFNISPEIIAEAKAENIVSKMVCTSKDIDQLLGMLDTIDDPMFKLNCCDAVNCEVGMDTRRVLCYAAFMDINVKDCNKNKDNVLLVKKMSFNDKLHRFDTFMQIYDEKYDYAKWKYFVDCNLITETKVFLQEGKIDKATRIFSRLDRNTINELTVLKIEQIVSLLNRDFLTKTVFLHTFIPVSLKYVPDSIGVFVKWLHGRVFLMEKQCDFPDCAIKFVEEVTNLVDLSASVRKYLHVQDLQDPTCLLRSLNDLKMFLHNFGIRLRLSEYLNNPFTVIRTLLHANSDIANFSALIADFLCPFVIKYNLDMDLLLMEEIENLLVYEEEYWVNIVPVLLKFITSTDKKLDLAYKILEITDIPWSKSVKDIARMICELAPRNPIAVRITEHMDKEQVLIILRKYNIHKTQFEKLDDKIFVVNRMIYLNKQSVIEDIHSLCMNDEDRQEADLLIINKLILKENYDEAMNILNANKPDIIIELSKQILNRCLQLSTSYNLPKKKRDPYFTVLPLIWNRLTKHSSICDKERFEFDYKIASTVFGINKYFNMQIQCTDIIKSEKRNALLETLLQEITDSCSTNDIVNFDTFTFKCNKLANFFDIEVEEVFLKCLVNGKPFNLFMRLGQYLLDTSKCSKVLSCWALYLLKYLKNIIVDDCDESLSDVISDVSKNHEDYLVEIQLAQKIIIKAMMNATHDDHLAVMEVMRWIDSCFYLTDQSNTLNMETLQIYRYDNALSYSIRKSIEAIKLSFSIYCATLGSLPNPGTNYLRYFTTNLTLTEDQLNNEMESLTSNIKDILNEGQLLTCFNLIKTIQEGYICNSNISKDTLMILQSQMQINWLPKTLEAVLSHRFVDKTLLFNLMLLCDTRQTRLWNYLQIYKRQPHKLSALAQVGLDLCRPQKNTQEIMELIKILNLCKWWTRITNKTINYEYFFKASCEDRLDALILAKLIKPADLPEYCLDFNLDLQKIYLKYLKIILRSWTPENLKLEEECRCILKHITNPDNILLLIDEMWPSVNYYYYEVFEVLLSIHKKLSPTKNSLFEGYKQLLLFLKTYKRVSSPSRSEIEKWFGTFPMKAFIDPLSETRLPLTNTFFSSDIWTIIKPEVNLDTYTDWFKVVPILQKFLNQNDICTYAINSALPGLSKGAGNTWELYAKYDHIVAKVEECANYITDLERATAAVYNLMCNITPGADKVKLAELSYKYVQIYKDTATNDSVEKVYMKVKQRYFNYSAMHILYKYHIAEDEYLKLVAQPLVLISTLYNDPRIPKEMYSLNPNCPDINSAVDELCLLFGLTTKKIKFGELLKFLESDSTLNLDRDGETDRLLRAYYISKSTDFHKALLKIGLNKDDMESSSMSVRANALKCFYYTSDISSLETMSGMSQEQFLTYLNKVSVMAKLEILGIKLNSINDLDQSSKKLLKKLAEVDKPLAIQCVANICKIYQFDDLMYWKFIVNTAIKFNLIKDLCDYVEYLRFRCFTDFIQHAWNAIINDAFKTEKNYLTALRLLQTCPVIYALNIEEYIKKCISHKRLEIAAVLLQYISEETTNSYLTVILKKERIIEDVVALQNEVLGIDKVLKILESYNKEEN